MDESRLIDLAGSLNSTGRNSRECEQEYVPSNMNCEDGYCIVGDCTCDCDCVKYNL